MSTSSQILSRKGTLQLVNPGVRVTIDPQLVDKLGAVAIPDNVKVSGGFELISINGNGTFDVQNKMPIVGDCVWQATKDHTNTLAAGQSAQTDLGPNGANPSTSPAQPVNTRGAFQSTVQTGTSAPQAIAHGLGYVPTIQLPILTAGHDGAGGAGTQAGTIQIDSADANEVIVTATNGCTYIVACM